MKKKRKIVYLPLMGRIGNQLFEYALAYTVQRECGDGTMLIVDTSSVTGSGWKNSLADYRLPDVFYVDNSKNEFANDIWIQRKAMKYIYGKLLFTTDPQLLFRREKKWQPLLNSIGVISIEKGFGEYKVKKNSNHYLYGYFQSERFFEKYKDNIREVLNLNEKLEDSNYPNLDILRHSNSVCISIKIEHNLGSDIYDVCNKEYYMKAIEYIRSKVEDPLFFLCSDNVELAREMFFSDFDGRVVEQADDYPVSLSLCAMSNCKHFIINNTSFGWWAQYLCNNKNKIVVAPNKWMLNKDPVSIYDNQDEWHLIEV